MIIVSENTKDAICMGIRAKRLYINTHMHILAFRILQSSA